MLVVALVAVPGALASVDDEAGRPPARAGGAPVGRTWARRAAAVRPPRSC